MNIIVLNTVQEGRNRNMEYKPQAETYIIDATRIDKKIMPDNYHMDSYCQKLGGKIHHE